MAGERKWLPFALISAVFLAVKLVVFLFMNPMGDEAYYWLWGQHLDWSYFDHPPLHAWLLALVSHTLGWSLLSARILTWVSLAIVLAIFWDWSPRLDPKAPRLWFWRTASVYLTSPFFFAMTTIAYNDHLLVALGLLSIHCFARFAERYAAGGRWIGWLYGAAIALGLTVLTKYNGVVIGLGFAAAILLRKDLRGVLRTPHPWLAALLAIAMQAPVFYWNLTEGLASYRFHIHDRWGDRPWILPCCRRSPSSSSIW